jgi:phosphonopyruvate decarboxylase
MIEELNCDFFTGVPDSSLADFLKELESSSFPNVCATHESQAVAIAFGAALTGKTPCVYMQNSGLGNAINPLTSLCIPFGIEPLLIIGHRENIPQHKVMGNIDKQLLEMIGWKNYILI